MAQRVDRHEPGAQGGETVAERAKQQVEETTGEIKERANRFGDRIRNRTNEMVEERKRRVADRIEGVGERLESRARPLEERGGLRGKAGEFVHRAGDRVERSAEYLRSHDVRTIRDDARGGICQRPFVSVGTALGTGFALGWLLHGGPDEEEQGRERGEQRDSAGRSRMGRLGRTAMTGATAMAGRALRKRIAGGKRQH